MHARKPSRFHDYGPHDDAVVNNDAPRVGEVVAVDLDIGIGGEGYWKAFSCILGAERGEAAWEFYNGDSGRDGGVEDGGS